MSSPTADRDCTTSCDIGSGAAGLRSSSMMKALLLLFLVAATAAAPKAKPTANEPVPISEAVAPTVVDLAIAKNLTGLVDAVIAANLTDALGPDFVGTVFAPSNEAFDTLAELVSPGVVLPLETVATVVKYHVINGTVLTAEELEDGQALTTLAGETLVVEKNGSAVFLVDVGGNKAEVVEADLQAGSAVVHVIDRVLLPFQLETAVPLPEMLEESPSPTDAPAPTEVAPSASAASCLAASGALALAALVAALLA